jgi:hypothetical protein
MEPIKEPGMRSRRDSLEDIIRPRTALRDLILGLIFLALILAGLLALPPFVG